MTTTHREYQPKAGDIVTVDGHRVGDIKTIGQIEDVLGETDHKHYRVLWEDGHESIFYPGNDAIIRPKKLTRQPRR